VASVLHLRNISVPIGSLIIGISLGGLVAAKLLVGTLINNEFGYFETQAQTKLLALDAQNQTSRDIGDLIDGEIASHRRQLVDQWTPPSVILAFAVH